MPGGIPKTEKEREEEHKKKYGEESKPPEERKGLGPSQCNWTYVIAAFLAGLVLGLLI